MRKCDEPYPYNGEDCLGPSISESSCSGELCGKPVKEIEDEEEVPEEEEDEDDDDEDDDDEDAVTSGEGGDDELVESVDLDENAADSSLEGLVRKKRSPRQSRRRYLLEKIRESNARKFQTHAKRESSRKITFRKVQVESKKVTFSKVKTFEKFFRHHNKRNSSSRPQKLPHLKEGGSQSHDEVKFLSKSGKRVTRSLRSDGLWLVSHPKESNPASKHSFSQILPPRSMHTPSRAGPHRLNKRSSKVPMKKSDTFPKRITISSPTLNLLRKTRRPLRRSRRSNQWNELKSRLRVQAAFITKPVRKPDEISKDDPYDVPLNAEDRKSVV